MPFVILPTNSASGGYDITNSLRFNSGSSDDLNRTFTTPTNNKIFTWSGWVKRSSLGTMSTIFRTIANGSNVSTGFRFEETSNIFRFFFFNASDGDLQTTQVFRDVSAWYHLVVAVDTTQATSSNRVKIYSNGSQITSFSTATYPTQNYNPQMNSAINHFIGKYSVVDEYYNGYMSDVFFIDGQQLTPSSFGETDEDTGIWKPKAFSGTYGTNGFYLQFKNSASLGTDSSGNGNNFTVNNLTSIDQTTDTPTNNFATLNSLDNYYLAGTFTEGNLKLATSSTPETWCTSTFALSAGKWYWETKITSGNIYDRIGIADNVPTSASSRLGNSAYTYAYRGNDGSKLNNSSASSYGSTWTTGDIIGVALDLDNNKLYFRKNGTWQNSGDPVAGTGQAFTVTATSSNGSGFYFPAFADDGGSVSSTVEFNFGNPTYTSGSYTDGAGYGNFSYAVPSGYYALNTKNLANFGF